MSGVFPDDFLWGTAVSAHQVEGGNVHNDWWEWEPFPSGAACDFVNHFEADLDRARALGTNAFRFSLEWSRVEPSPGEHDAAAIAYYERLVAACHERGLRPILTLVQFTLPRWCAARGGWLAEETLAAFERHVAWVADRFPVDIFVTLNEPNVQAGAGYVAGVFPPGKHLRRDLADRCLAALARAHVAAYRILHDRIPDVAVGVSPHVVSWQPSRLDLLGLVAREGERFNWGFLDALEAEAPGSFDFVGMNYFMGMPAHLVGVLRFAGFLARRAGPGTSDVGWPIDAAGFETALLEAHRRYGRPILVTENGIACASDDARPGFLRDHVAALERAMSKGARVRGYCHWSLIDNFEWHEGFAPRFGLYAIDYATQARTLRESGRLYARLIRARTRCVAAT